MLPTPRSGVVAFCTAILAIFEKKCQKRITISEQHIDRAHEAVGSAAGVGVWCVLEVQREEL